MNTYRAQVITEVPRGWSRDDLLATVVTTVSALTVVDRARVVSLVRDGLQKVNVVFQGLNDVEAAATAAAVQRAIPTSSDVLLDVREGRKFRRAGGPR